jgi:hypothetical protein
VGGELIGEGNTQESAAASDQNSLVLKGTVHAIYTRRTVIDLTDILVPGRSSQGL